MQLSHIRRCFLTPPYVLLKGYLSVEYTLKRDFLPDLTNTVIIVSVIFSRFYLVIKKLLVNFAALTRN